MEPYFWTAANTMVVMGYDRTRAKYLQQLDMKLNRICASE